MSETHKNNNKNKGSNNSQFGSCWIYSISLEISKKYQKVFKGKSNITFCSTTCRSGVIYKNADKILEYYDENGSINKSLKLIGKLGNVGGYSNWAKIVLSGNY